MNENGAGLMTGPNSFSIAGMLDRMQAEHGALAQICVLNKLGSYILYKNTSCKYGTYVVN